MSENRHNDDVIISELRGLKELLSLEITYLKNNIEELEKRTNLSVDTARKQVEQYNIRLNERITVIEIWQSNSMGKMAIIFTIIGMAVVALFGWISKHF